MVNDIRSFFGGKPATPAGSSQKSSQTTPGKVTPNKNTKKRKSKVIESDEDEDDARNAVVKITPKSTPKKSSQQPREKKPKLEDADASSYFETSNKIKRVAAPPRKAPVKKETKKVKNDDDDFLVDDDDFDFDDEDLMQVDDAPVKTEPKPTNGTKQKNGQSNNVVPSVAATVKTEAKTTPVKRKAVADSSDDDFVEPKLAKSVTTSKKTPTKKEPVASASSKKELPAPKKIPTKAPPKPTTKPATKPAKEADIIEPEEDLKRKAVLESIEKVELPDIEPATGEDKKFNYRAMATRPGPQAPGSKEIPVGNEDCLAGLTFVFTGVLESIDRDDAVNLVKRYGGRVTGAPSSKTSYVVLGSDAGPKKIETIKKNNIPTINEDGLLQLIRTLPAHGGSGATGQMVAAKKEAEEKKVMQMAKEMEAQERQKAKTVAAKGGPALNSQLWTEKYAPQKIKELVGNGSLVAKLQRWLQDWPVNVKAGFKKPGKDGMGLYRAVIISGPPGVGKTTTAHLVAKLEGYDILEYNASDTRNEKLLREKLAGVTDNTSISGFLKHDDPENKGSQKLVLIMDEIDGMSGGDRGGVGALKKIINTTRIPIICICNDRRHQKLKPLDRTAYDLAFRRPQANEIRSRIMSIAFKEGLKLSPQAVDQFVEGTHSDIRQILNLLSTYRLSRTDLQFDDSKKVVKAAEKYIILKPWDIAGKFLSSSMFHPTSKTTLNEKIELYFNDHEFSSLMLQENYLKTNPDRARNAGSPKEQNLKKLELAERASESISNGDLVDAMIHGSQQQWSLMPTHAVFSCVTPAYWMHGSSTGQYNFTSWLGNNSKTGKLVRLLREIQVHMRLRISGDRNAVRQNYMQTIFDRLVREFTKEGAAAIDGMIELMDEYYLTKEDFDSIIELSLGPNNGEELMKDVPSNVKAAFTRKYNAASHPMAFQKAGGIVATKGGKKERPDVEDAFEDSDEGEVVEDAVVDEEEEEDLSKDKMIKAKAVKGGKNAPAAARKAAPKKANAKPKK